MQQEAGSGQNGLKEHWFRIKQPETTTYSTSPLFQLQGLLSAVRASVVDSAE